MSLSRRGSGPSGSDPTLNMLRLATQNDFDQLYYIYMHESVNPFLSFEIQPIETFKPIYQELERSGDLFIYEVEGNVVGTGIIVPLGRRCNHVVRISTLAVNPAWQGKGIGQALMLALVERIKTDKAIKRIELFAEADNHRAICFYQKQGFVIEGTLKNWFKREGEDNYVDEHIFALNL